MCALTNLVVRQINGEPDFMPTSTRQVRFHSDRQFDTIRSVLTVIIDTCRSDPDRRMLSDCVVALCQIVLATWTCLGNVRATPRRLLFFATTCLFMLRSGEQPHHIMPRVLQLTSLNKSTAIAALRGHCGVMFSPKTLSDYYTNTLKQIRFFSIRRLSFIRSLIFFFSRLAPADITAVRCQVKTIIATTLLTPSSTLLGYPP